MQVNGLMIYLTRKPDDELIEMAKKIVELGEEVKTILYAPHN